MEQSDEQITRIGKYTSEFRGKDKIGFGGFGQVYIGYQIANKKNKVAIKLINLDHTTFEEVMNEVKLLLNNRSQGTLEILATQKIKFGSENQDYYAIVMEKMDGSLRKLLKQKGKLTEEQAIEWGSKIIACYKFLYQAKVIHRDLKPENVLYRKVGDQTIFKIADFGNSRSSKDSRSFTVGKGSIFYISPQQALLGNYTNKTDVYAFGCMLFEFLVGSEKVPIEVSKVRLPSGGVDTKQVEKVLENLGISPKMIQLIQRCLMHEESQRISWKDILAEPIFQKLIKKVVPNKIGNQINQGEAIFENKKLENKGIEMVPKQMQSKIEKLTPDKTTRALKFNMYRQDYQNKNVWIYQGPCEGLASECLLSSDFVADGELVFTIKAIKLEKGKFSNGTAYTQIMIGVMDSEVKGKRWEEAYKHSVFFSPKYQEINRPNEQPSKCNCQRSLPQLPCLIECHVNQETGEIAWHYNGKEQAKTNMPKSWTDKRKLCAVVSISNKGDCVQFM